MAGDTLLRSGHYPKTIKAFWGLGNKIIIQVVPRVLAAPCMCQVAFCDIVGLPWVIVDQVPTHTPLRKVVRAMQRSKKYLYLTDTV
eukprot:6129311-Karenia_brevis.AAC.1